MATLDDVVVVISSVNIGTGFVKFSELKVTISGGKELVAIVSSVNGSDSENVITGVVEWIGSWEGSIKMTSLRFGLGVVLRFIWSCLYLANSLK